MSLTEDELVDAFGGLAVAVAERQVNVAAKRQVQGDIRADFAPWVVRGGRIVERDDDKTDAH